MIRTCRDCGREFELSAGEAEFYKTRGLKIPRRCKSCRQKAKDPRYSDLRDVMRDTPVLKRDASGRDISRTGGDVKAIAPQYLDGFVEDLQFSPEENYLARRHYGNWDEFLDVGSEKN